MAKVTFEFDDVEDNDEVNIIVNRHKLVCAISELSDFFRELYNGKLYTNELITVKENKVLTEEDYKRFQEQGEYPVKGTKSYISTDYIENKLDNILCDVRSLLQY